MFPEKGDDRRVSDERPADVVAEDRPTAPADALQLVVAGVHVLVLRLDDGPVAGAVTPGAGSLGDQPRAVTADRLAQFERLVDTAVLECTGRQRDHGHHVGHRRPCSLDHLLCVVEVVGVELLGDVLVVEVLVVDVEAVVAGVVVLATQQHERAVHVRRGQSTPAVRAVAVDGLGLDAVGVVPAGEDGAGESLPSRREGVPVRCALDKLAEYLVEVVVEPTGVVDTDGLLKLREREEDDVVGEIPVVEVDLLASPSPLLDERLHDAQSHLVADDLEGGQVTRLVRCHVRDEAATAIDSFGARGRGDTAEPGRGAPGLTVRARSRGARRRRRLRGGSRRPRLRSAGGARRERARSGVRCPRAPGSRRRHRRARPARAGSARRRPPGRRETATR